MRESKKKKKTQVDFSRGVRSQPSNYAVYATGFFKTDSFRLEQSFYENAGRGGVSNREKKIGGSQKHFIKLIGQRVAGL